MEKKRSKFSKFIMSPITRLLGIVLFTVVSILAMTLIDAENGFLVGASDGNFLKRLLEWFRVSPINITTRAYLVTFSIIGVFWVLCIVSLFYGNVKRRVLKADANGKIAFWKRLLFYICYYLIGLAIAGLAILVLYLVGAYNNWSNNYELHLKEIFWAIFICTAAILVIICLLIAVFLVLKWIMRFLAWACLQILVVIAKDEEYKSLKGTDGKVNGNVNGNGFGGGNGAPDKIMISGMEDDPNILLKEKMFPSLTKIDKEYALKEAEAQMAANAESENAEAVTDATKLEEENKEAAPSVENVENAESTEIAENAETAENAVAVEGEGGDQTAVPEATAEEAEETKEPLDLKDLIVRFQSFLNKNYKLYYELPLLRSFVAGLGTSKLLILQGLSGTGKSMLPRMFGEFVNSKTFFCPVQSTWKDRTDIIGYYSDFTKEFKETEFLKRLYEASYRKDQVNLMVLDEMNISRIEYYFADFLSTFEYPSEDWLIKLMQVKEGQVLPEKLEDGSVRIPLNTWFIGTANTDDSTFTITDKVYDRAVILEFNEKHLPFETTAPSDPMEITVEELQSAMDAATSDEALCLNDADIKKFEQLNELIVELFEIRFGNRIMRQIEKFVPIYVACGGTKEAALDYMFARKVMRKLEGKYDEYIKDGLLRLQKFLARQYGNHVFKETEAYINKLLKKF